MKRPSFTIPYLYGNQEVRLIEIGQLSEPNYLGLEPDDIEISYEQLIKLALSWVLIATAILCMEMATSEKLTMTFLRTIK